MEAVSPYYELVNAAMSLGLGRAARLRGVAALATLCRPAGPVVDVGAGPGPSTRLILEALAPPYVVAVEPSERMASGLRGSPLLDPVVAVAEALPLRSRCCAAATAFYSARDFMDPAAGIAEMARVAGCVLVVDLFLPEGRVARLLLEAWVCRAVPVIAMMLARPVWWAYRRLCDTLRGWVGWRSVAEPMARAGMLVAVWSAGLGSVAAVLGVRP